jgi:carboxypeptidase C (cathepsin A)
MAFRFTAARPLRVAATLLIVCWVSGARAEEANPPASQPAATPSPSPSGQKGGAGRGAATPPAAAEQHRLPPDSTTRQTLALPGRTLDFTATAGSIRLFDDKGEPQADIAFNAYQLESIDRASRPVTFLFNGGPGASSAWLQLGDAGPWRISISGEGAVSSATPDLLPNAETWLDFTDLVFIDPPGTGYSQLTPSNEESRRRFWSVSGDIPPLAEVARRWLVKQGRTGSPLMVVGESYGGYRGPVLTRALQTGEGFGVIGMALLSPVLDFSWLPQGTDPLALVGRLPSMAAITAEAAGQVPDLDAVERYAASEFIADLLRGPRDQAALDRLIPHVAALTGLDATLVRRRAARIDVGTFLRERRPGEWASIYDGTVASPDAAPTLRWSEQPDPVLDALRAPLTGGMLELYRWLGWQPDGPYRVLNADVSRGWDWGGQHGLNPPSARDALGDALALDPRLRVLVVHGQGDLITPYFTTKLLLAQMPQIGAPDRVRLLVTPGGHMMYLRDDARVSLRNAAKAMAQTVP